MKLRIEVDEQYEEDEVVIHCSSITPEIVHLQQLIKQNNTALSHFAVYKQDTQYYVAFGDILFFETDDGSVQVHTRQDAYETKLKLYELENVLPPDFIRISKSAIVNCGQIYSVRRNLTSSSLIQFQNTHKQIYVSRAYYKLLMSKLEEKSLLTIAEAKKCEVKNYEE